MNLRSVLICSLRQKCVIVFSLSFIYYTASNGSLYIFGLSKKTVLNAHIAIIIGVLCIEHLIRYSYETVLWFLFEFLIFIRERPAMNFDVIVTETEQMGGN